MKLDPTKKWDPLEIAVRNALNRAEKEVMESYGAPYTDMDVAFSERQYGMIVGVIKYMIQNVLVDLDVREELSNPTVPPIAYGVAQEEDKK